jgi:folate-binding protein YgfZ
VPLFGQDVTEANLPQEVNRDRLAINFTKGCYIGQETVARVDALGHVNRLLVALRGVGDKAPDVGLELTDAAGKPIGALTSAAYSYRLGCPIALGYVRRQLANAGTAVQSAQGTFVVTATPIA